MLKQTAFIAKYIIRNSDLLIRFGGEEFILLMPITTIDGGVSVAEKIREAIEINEHPGIGSVTASFGVAERQKGEAFEIWYSRADEALYNAKKSGRNRVKTASVP